MGFIIMRIFPALTGQRLHAVFVDDKTIHIRSAYRHRQRYRKVTVTFATSATGIGVFGSALINLGNAINDLDIEQVIQRCLVTGDNQVLRLKFTLSFGIHS
jgi:hypothetical protein